MARPFLADPEIVNKAAEGREDEINVCIGCNQVRDEGRNILVNFDETIANIRFDPCAHAAPCNQACLDHTFKMMTASCLVNPQSGYETELTLDPVAPEKRIKIAVVGGGCAGLSASCTAAERGHDVTLFEASGEIGGQFNYAKMVPGELPWCQRPKVNICNRR